MQKKMRRLIVSFLTVAMFFGLTLSVSASVTAILEEK